MALYAGQSAGGVGEVQPAGTVVEELVEETRTTIGTLQSA
jgi:nitronate monooxygenase